MPVPRGRDGAGYFAPLKGLKVDNGTELYLGLVHRTDGVSGTVRRMAVANRVGIRSCDRMRPPSPPAGNDTRAP
jgi:hypothetical protein